MSARAMPYAGAATAIGALGNGAVPVTGNEISNEMNTRGYKIQVVTTEPVVHHAPPEFQLSRAQAIMIACDVSIEGFGLPHTFTHPFVCPSSGCFVEGTTWNSLIPYATDAANGLLGGKYGLPDWFKQMMNIHGMAGIGAMETYGLGGFMDWLQANPAVLTAIGGVLNTYGMYLTSKQAQEAIRKNVPPKDLTKENMAALLAALQATTLPDGRSAIPAGTTGTVAAGAVAAASPAWLMPVMIGAGAIVVIMLMKK